MQSRDRVAAAFLESAANFRALSEQAGEIEASAQTIAQRMQRGGKVMFCGNGGSAADAQHLATELSGRYLRNRRALPALALTVDSSALTAIGNDYGFPHVFARQIEAVGRQGDVLIAISTSGNSENVLNAVRAARQLDIWCLALTGAGGGALAGLCDVVVKVPSDRVPRIQEMHIAVGHAICDLLETWLAP